MATKKKQKITLESLMQDSKFSHVSSRSPQMSEKPRLESKLVHLLTPSGNKSDLVILLDQNGAQAGGIFDLRDPVEKQNLLSLFDHVYQSEEDRISLFLSQLDNQEKTRFNQAQKVGSANYSGLGVFYRNQYYSSLSEFLDLVVANKIVKPAYVWASLEQEVAPVTAQDVWDRLCEDLEIEIPPEAVPGSLDLLNESLKEFVATNRDRLIVFRPDYSTAILLD